MAKVRNSIELLTKILRENGTSKVRAETFRLAKFNEAEAAPALWQLLLELLVFCNCGEIGAVSEELGSSTQGEQYVRAALQRLGFPLPKEALGSRMLLLALGWVLSSQQMFNRFAHQQPRSLAEADTSHSHAQDRKLSSPAEPGKPASTVERLRQLLWLNGRLQLQLRSLFSLNRRKLLLQHKMHEATSGVSASPEASHLTMMDLHLLRNPELLQKRVHLLEQDSQRLQHLVQWSQHEDVFWNWMSSVLDAQGSTKLWIQGRAIIQGPPVHSFLRSRHHLREAVHRHEPGEHQLEQSQDLNICGKERSPTDTVPCYAPRLLLLPKASGPRVPSSLPEEIARLRIEVQQLKADVDAQQESILQQMTGRQWSNAVCIPPLTPADRPTGCG